MLLTSRQVSGDEASRMRFFSRYVEDSAVLDTAIAAAAEIAANDPAATREVKRLLLAGPGRELRARYDEENTVMLTTLRPKPMTDVFASFLRRKGK